MSEQQVEGAPAGTGGEAAAAIELPPQGDAAFGALMDALAPESDAATQARGEDGRFVGEPGTDAAAGEGAAAGAGVAAGTPAAPAPGAAAPGAAQPAAGAPGGEGAAAGNPAGAAPVGGEGALPAAWTADPVALAPKFGELATKLEENTSNAYQAKALEEVKTEHTAYFAALNKHPRLLVGQTVPAIGKEGDETLRDENDVRSWQEAVKGVLLEEVKDRAGRAIEENRGFLDTVHQSIELFQNNHDLIPGAKTFDVELANRFTSIVQPYELRVEGKLQGYSIPVQPIIDKVRAELVAARAKAPAAAPATGTGAAAPPPAGGGADAPQAGIVGKAGSGSSAEDFSALFGTLGLPDLRI